MRSVIDTIIHADVLDGLKRIDDGVVTLVMSSPPYNVGINYKGYKDNHTWAAYLEWLEAIMAECKRVLRPGGRLVINIDSIVNHENENKTEYFRPIYADLVNIGRKIGLNFRTDICWYKHQVVGRATAWGSFASCSNPVIRRNHEYLLVWSNGPWSLEGDSEQSDMTREEFEQYTMSFWHIQPETRKMGGHPVPFPEKLVERVVKLFSYRGDVVLDPFCGSGTTPSVACSLGRRYIGIDNCEEYVKYAKDRIRKQKEDIFPVEYVPRSVRLANTKAKDAEIEGDMFSAQEQA